MLTATDTLVSLRDSAVALRDRADSFIVELDTAIEASPKDLGAVIDALKDEVLSGLASGAKPTKTTPTPAKASEGLTCEYCGKTGIKNDLGMSIHIGRDHPEKSKKGRKAAAATRKRASRESNAASVVTDSAPGTTGVSASTSN